MSLKDVTQSADLLGAVARVPESIPLGRLTQDTVKLDFIDPSYPRGLVYWALRSPEFRAYCRAHATGTTNLGLAREDFLAFELPSPDQELLSLIELLEALETRIELLRQTSATLEAIAKALFRSWFVDFEPVRTKFEGREPEGMDAVTAALFPREFEDSELGLIPKGWSCRPLDSIAQFLNGLALQKFPPESDSEYLPIIKIAQLRAGHTNAADRASALLKAEYVVEDGDVLFSWSGSLEVEVWCGGRGALNQHLFKVTSSEVPKWFYFFATKLHLPKFREIAADKATTMGHIQRRHLTEAQVAVPPSKCLEKLSPFFDSVFERMIVNSLQAQNLAKVRDALLTCLTSGQFRISEAKTKVEDSLA
ncbi:MAG: restriction endonuclease subunit S [Silanimonas sp.]|nr:restriction endonuclease subunit S [Silanimonas sp.]